MGGVASVLTGQDPFADDKRKHYEADREGYYRACGYELKDGAWKTISGSPAQGIAQMGRAYTGPNCQPGPWKSDSQLPNVPTPPPPAPPPASAGPFNLTPPGDLKPTGRW